MRFLDLKVTFIHAKLTQIKTFLHISVSVTSSRETTTTHRTSSNGGVLTRANFHVPLVIFHSFKLYIILLHGRTYAYLGLQYVPVMQRSSCEGRSDDKHTET